MPELRNLSICFDLDGTLIDTAPDLVRVLNTVIAEDGLSETHYTAARDRVGFGAKVLIKEAFARAHTSLSEERADELLSLFLEIYAQDIARLSQPFPGVLDTLRDLKNAGARLSVCTNKPGNLARPLIEALDMTPFFERTIGSRDGYKHKPNPEHVFAAAGHKDTRNIIMIGDALPDVLVARNAGIPVIIMGYGYADTPPATLRADRVLRSFRALPEAIISL